MDYYNGYPRDSALSSVTLSRYRDLCATFFPFRKTNNILDVGCGDGHFLEVARDLGWNVFGTEYTRDAVAVCEAKGISMAQGPLGGISFAHGFFDVITSFEVLEHINNPVDEAKSMHNLLRPGGGLYVTTPNFGSISRSLLGPKWNVICYPEHLCYFTEDTMKRLFFKMGFQLLTMTTTGISLDRLRAGMHDNKPMSTQVDEAVRRRAESSGFMRFAKTATNMALDATGKGDTIKALFRKT